MAAETDRSVKQDEKLLLVNKNDENCSVNGASRGGKKWQIILILGFANLCINCVFTLQAPFYPRKASEKGATATEFGLVFGMSQVAILISSPIFGTLLGRINPKTIYIVGILLASTATIFFGCLNWVEGRANFIGFSLLLRMLEGCGSAAFYAAKFSIITVEFPDAISSTFGIVQTFSGVGLICGPSLGGLLYKWGGFVLPFVTVGFTLFLMAIVSFFVLPTINIEEAKGRPSETSKEPKRGFVDLIKIPAVLLDTFCILFAASTTGFLEATLEPHLRTNFGFSAFMTGMIFIIYGLLYGISSPIWGKLSDGGFPLRNVTFIGCLLTILGVSLIGPPPGIYHTTIWLVCIGLAIYGAGSGATLNSVFSQISSDARENGFPDTLATYGLVGSLWVCSYSLGSSIGPVVGGVLLDYFGFRAASYYVLLNQFLIASLLMYSIKTAKNKGAEEVETEPTVCYTKTDAF